MPGEIVGERYELVRLLGRGGMGAVYEAQDTTTGQRVALKTINMVGDRSKTDTQVGRFRREVRAAMAIEDEHIVQVLDSGVDAATGTPFLVMEYLIGEDLQALVDRLGPMAPDAALRIAAQACEGLRRAHEVGIVHRDIKPANLFLVRDEQGKITVKVLDFGIAKVTPHRLHAMPDATTGLTRTGSMLGSPHYMSPEQARGIKDIDHRTDIWSLGVVLYRALAGITPHGDIEAFGELIICICHDAPRSLQERAPWIAPEVSAVVHGAVRIDVHERYPDAASMLLALYSLLPNGSDLHESMLVSVSEADRASVARKFDAATVEEEPSKHVIMVNTEGDQISGHEATLHVLPGAVPRVDLALLPRGPLGPPPAPPPALNAPPPAPMAPPPAPMAPPRSPSRLPLILVGVVLVVAALVLLGRFAL